MMVITVTHAKYYIKLLLVSIIISLFLLQSLRADEGDIEQSIGLLINKYGYISTFSLNDAEKNYINQHRDKYEMSGSNVYFISYKKVNDIVKTSSIETNGDATESSNAVTESECDKSISTRLCNMGLEK